MLIEKNVYVVVEWNVLYMLANLLYFNLFSYILVFCLIVLLRVEY